MGKTCSQKREGGLIVYMCAACARQGSAGQRTQGTASRVQLRGWMGGRGAVASEKEEGLRSEPRSWDGGITKRTAAGLPGLAGLKVTAVEVGPSRGYLGSVHRSGNSQIGLEAVEGVQDGEG